MQKTALLIGDWHGNMQRGCWEVAATSPGCHASFSSRCHLQCQRCKIVTANTVSNHRPIIKRFHLPFQGLRWRSERCLGAGMARSGCTLCLPDFLDSGSLRNHCFWPCRGSSKLLQKTWLPNRSDCSTCSGQALNSGAYYSRRSCGYWCPRPRYRPIHGSK